MILGFGVGSGSDADAGGTGEVFVACEVAVGSVDEPVEDAEAFLGDEDVGEVVDLTVVGNDAFEGNQAHAVPEGEAAGSYFGAVVAEQPELVGGVDAEEALANAAGLESAAAGEEFDAGTVEPVAWFALGADDDAAAVEKTDGNSD
ncbi:hypothetical protein KK483_06270 [Streptomyces sp. FIT100]|nr:hypothetical protein KK483_06270 [Streptomyces sp. FIT100]